MQEDYTSYKSTRHAKYLCNYHFVWIPKYRRDILSPKIIEEFKKIVYGIAGENGFQVIAMEAESDHVHLFVSAPPVKSPANLANTIKGVSSRRLGKIFPEIRTRDGEIWTRSYFVTTHGNISSATIQKYIDEQNGDKNAKG